MKLSRIIPIVLFSVMAITASGQSVYKVDSLKREARAKLDIFKQVQKDSISKTSLEYKTALQDLRYVFNRYINAKSDSIFDSRIRQRDSLYTQETRFLGTIISRKGLDGSTIIIDDSLLFLYNRRLLRCVDINTKKLLWQSECSYDNTRGNMVLTDSLIIVPASSNGEINAYHKADGVIEWSVDSCEFIGQTNYLSMGIPFINRNGQLYEIDHTTGQLLKRKEPAPERMFHYKEYEIVVKVKKICKKEGDGISHIDRTIVCTNKISGELKWEKNIVTEFFGTSYSSYIIRNSLWLDVGEENFGVINIKTGKVKRAAFNNIGYYDFLYTLKNGFVRWTEDHRIEYTNIRNSRKSWVYETPEGDRVYRPFNGPKSTNDKILYLQANRNAIRAFNLNTGKVDWEFSCVSNITSNLVLADDVLYFTDGDGLVALDASEKNDKKRWDDYHLRFPDEKNKEESEPELLSEEYRTPMGEKFDEQDVLGDFVVYIRTKNAKGKQIAIKFNMPGRVVLYNGEVVKDNKIEGYTIKKDFEKIYLRAEKIKPEDDE